MEVAMYVRALVIACNVMVQTIASFVLLDMQLQTAYAMHVIIPAILVHKQCHVLLVYHLLLGLSIVRLIDVSAILDTSITTIQVNVLLVHLLIQNARHALQISVLLLQPS